jgi:RNA polymerase sigma-70 factor (ECF subfamily)
VQTWLVAILKRKIIDHLRKASRESAVRTETPADADFSDFFDERGHWTQEAAPSSWNVDPDTALEQKDFMAVLHGCLSKMPPKLRDAFVLRELEEATSEEIMKSLDISSSNVWVLLHRARLKLRACVESNWLSISRG